MHIPFYRTCRYKGHPQYCLSRPNNRCERDTANTMNQSGESWEHKKLLR